MSTKRTVSSTSPSSASPSSASPSSTAAAASRRVDEAGAADARADELLEQLHALMHRLKAHLHEALRDDAEGLAPMEARALNFFARHPGAAASDLVQHARRDKAQVTRLVKELLGRGLLAAEVDANDRRVNRLNLTADGRAVQRKMQLHRRRAARALCSDLSAAEQASLARLLARCMPDPGEPRMDAAAQRR